MRFQPPFGRQLDKSHSLSQGLVGYYPLNERGGQVASDLVQRGRGQGVVTGTTVISGIDGGVSRSFNGTSDKIVTTSVNSTDGQIDNSLTFTCWLASTNLGISGTAFGAQGASSYYVQLGQTSASKLQFGMFDGTHNPFVAGLANNVLNQWYFLAGVRDVSAGTLSFYINAVLQGTTADTITGTNSYSGIAIGDTSLNFFAGRVVNCRAYNLALNQRQISRLLVEPYAGILQRRPLGRTGSVTPPAGAGVLQLTTLQSTIYTARL